MAPNGSQPLRRLAWMVAGGVGIMTAIVIGHVLYMTAYGHLINPGQPRAHYTEHANASGPWFSIVVGIAIWFVVARWMGRKLGRGAVTVAVGMWVTYMVIELAIFAAVGSVLVKPLFLVSWTTKLAAGVAGAKAGEGRRER